MATHELLQWGEERLRLGPWRAGANVGYLAPVPGTRPPRSAVIARSLEAAAARGYDAVVTAALAPAEVDAFMAAGFELRERLHLLAHDLQRVPSHDDRPLRRARRSDRRRVLEIDRLAFDEFWTLDANGLADALAATPSTRFRVAELDRRVLAYAVHGRAGGGGYVQRIAVDPATQGHGLGTLVVLDGLRWMRRRGCDRAVVNTQLTNERALGLYLRLGFRLEPQGLAVLERRLADPAGTDVAPVDGPHPW